MEKISRLLLSLALIFCAVDLAAQSAMFGVTATGGTSGAGVIFTTDPDGTNLQVRHEWLVENPGATPGTHLLLEGGFLYGMAGTGGEHGLGVIFKFDPATDDYSVLHSFDGDNGAAPAGGLCLYDGKLYGMTSAGGTQGVGTIFEYEHATSTFTKIHDFTVAAGNTPGGSLTLAGNSKLYGFTLSGGANDLGTLFELTPPATLVPASVTHKGDFDGTNGALAAGNLTLAGNGKLYGVTSFGGANVGGTLIEFDPTSGGIVKKFDFDGFLGGTNGAFPTGTLALYTNGFLYGTCAAGGANELGTIFEFNPGTGAFTKWHDFEAATGNASSSLAPGGSFLYGMTASGGANGQGAIYRFEVSGGMQSFTAFHDLQRNSTSTLTILPGKGYGMTSTGGLGNFGYIFDYDFIGSSFTKHIDFNVALDGMNPAGGLCLGDNGKAYGTASGGGEHGFGTIYEFDPVTYDYEKLHDFDGDGGIIPFGKLVFTNGKIYGITQEGGTSDAGVFFELDPVLDVFEVKFEFDPAATNGAIPTGIVLAGNGKIYGTTTEGGANDEGILFEFDPVSGDFAKKIDFDESVNGAEPGPLTIANGKLYGTTESGGANDFGILFEYQPGSTSVVKKQDLDEATGYGESIMTTSQDDIIFGTAEGGANDNGVIFRYDPVNNDYDKKHDFTESFHPSALTVSGNGNLYGVAEDSGTGDDGALFEFDTDNEIFTIVNDLDAPEGTNPVGLEFFGQSDKEDQTISFSELPPKTFGDASFTLTATSTSELAVTFESSDLNVVEVLGTTVTIVGAGSVDITASQAGNDDFNPAPSVTNTLVVNKATQTISFESLAPRSVSDPDFTLFAVASSNLPVSFESTQTAVATVTGNTVAILTGGSTTIIASQPGNANYNAATPIQRTLIVTKLSQTITFPEVSGRVYGDPPFDLVATATSTLPITFSSSNENIATVSGKTVTILSAGSVSISARQLGNEIFLPTTTFVNSLFIDKASQTIPFTDIPNKLVGDPPFDLPATTNAGQTITYTSSLPEVASVTGNTVTIHSGGVTNIRATQGGGPNHKAALNVDMELQVNKLSQTLEFPAITDKVLGDAPFGITATASSGLAAEFTSTSDKISIANNTATMTKAGKATITANQAGNGSYNAATPVTREFCIKPAKPLITLTNPNTETPVLTSSSSEGNQWYRDGAAISGASGASLTVSAPGVYTVQVTIETCVGQLSNQFPVVVTGLERHAGGLMLFPNPASESVTIRFDKVHGLKQVVIFAADSRVMTDQSTHESELTLPVSDFGAGFYFVSVKTSDGVSWRKFLKQ